MIYNAIHFLKSGKTKKSSAGEIEEVIDSDSYRQSNIEKEYLQLDLDYQIFENIYFQINEILLKHGCFLRIFEQLKKFHNLLKKC